MATGAADVPAIAISKFTTDQLQALVSIKAGDLVIIADTNRGGHYDDNEDADDEDAEHESVAATEKDQSVVESDNHESENQESLATTEDSDGLVHDEAHSDREGESTQDSGETESDGEQSVGAASSDALDPTEDSDLGLAFSEGEMGAAADKSTTQPVNGASGSVSDAEAAGTSVEDERDNGVTSTQVDAAIVEDDEEDQYGTQDSSSRPKLYVVCKVQKDDAGSINDIALVALKYDEYPDNDDAKSTYQLYGNRVKHNMTLEIYQKTAVDSVVDITNAVPGKTWDIYVRPTGDEVRRMLHYGSCPAQACDEGYIDSIGELKAMLPTYTVPSTLPHRPLCPSCIGKTLTKQHQNLRADLEAFLQVDFGQLVEFYGRLNPRRTALGYEFRQFDEREWNYEFGDMLSEDEDDDGGANHNADGYQYWAEAMDPSANVVLRPVSEATIAALTRRPYAEVKRDEGDECKVCQQPFADAQRVVCLPCGHVYCDAGCVEQWLRQFDTCPACRARVPAVEEVAKEGEKRADALAGVRQVEGGVGVGQTVYGDAQGEAGKDGVVMGVEEVGPEAEGQQVVMDGEDVEMSDAPDLAW